MSQLLELNWKIIINEKNVIRTRSNAEEQDDKQLDKTMVLAAIITPETTTRNSNT